MNPKLLHQEVLELRQKKEELVSLEKLLLNADFRKFILGGYLQTHALSLVMSKGQLGIEPQQLRDIDRQLDAVALFDMYLTQQRNLLESIDEKIMEAEDLRDNNPG